MPPGKDLEQKKAILQLLFSFSPSSLGFLFSGSAPESQTVDGFSATNLTAGLWCGASGQAPLPDPGLLAGLVVSHTSAFTCLSAEVSPDFKRL